ncbi:MAG: hypothetical protein GC203_11675 [Phenylobacterium sp.]|uniref:hypothetical protein n=1 Tax=Phenylobacterium sp. TaxID=1871053 RepID=UPI0025E91654|nr:hypothetical protein [Phenylobacterium sp.]MBI1198512.1 hypothetical protein [Phenylobacterium sp.]
MSRPRSYSARCARLEAAAPPRDAWRARGCGDVARTLRALGVPRAAFLRVLDLAAAWRADDRPAALADLCDDYRVGVAPVEAAHRFSGRPIGVCGDFAVLVWPKTEGDTARRRR